MREIKFRGKRLDNRKWIQGSLVTTTIQPLIISSCDNSDIGYPVDDNTYEVDPDTIGQFTGLTDRNGKEVYEGDYEQNQLGRHIIVEYHHGGFWLRTFETGFGERLKHDRQICVRGNIHDNPELITALRA